MQNAGSPPILKKYGYILNIWPSCSEVSTLLVEIRGEPSVLRDPAKVIQSLRKYTHISSLLLIVHQLLLLDCFDSS